MGTSCALRFQTQMNNVKNFFSQNAASVPKEKEKCRVVSSVSKGVLFTSLIMLQ